MIEVILGDVLDPDSLDRALQGVHTAYYLIHSLSEAGDFARKDATGARNFAQAAAKHGVSRIIYLGGLGEAASGLSKHLRSRQEVGDILRETGIPVIEFRASLIIGAGSLSFELVRALVEVLPVMITPKWVSIPAQPIAIADVLDYLLAALDAPEEVSKVFEIGGADAVSYGGIMSLRRGSGTEALANTSSPADATSIESLAKPGNTSLCARWAKPDRGGT